jgi:Major capsid protein 13-like
MATGATAVSGVIEPTVFNPYFRELSTRVNAFFASGIVQTVPDLTFGDKGGTMIQMPFWQALGSRAQLLNDTDDLTISAITAVQDTAVQHARALVYGATDLSAALAGDDPMTAIAAGVGENWSYEFNMCLISTLKGAFGALAAESSPKNVHDISALSGAAGYIDGESFIDAAQLLGDHKDRIMGVLMHSAVEAALAKNDLIEFIRDSEGNLIMKSFMGKQVIVDDANTPNGNAYSTYLFGPGAIGWGEGTPKVPSETNREPLLGGGQEYLVTRRHYVLHPRGVRWTPGSGVPAKTTPSDAELATSTNWTRVYDAKNIRMVELIHNVP